MGLITTSYFARARTLDGTKISTARYNNPRMTGGNVEIQTSFAPSIQLLSSYKAGKTTWERYRTLYKKEQKRHYEEKPEDFKNLLERAELEEIVLLCYERYEGPKTKCHRVLLYDMLQDVAKELGYTVKFSPEQQSKK